MTDTKKRAETFEVPVLPEVFLEELWGRQFTGTNPEGEQFYFRLSRYGPIQSLTEDGRKVLKGQFRFTNGSVKYRLETTPVGTTKVDFDLEPEQKEGYSPPLEEHFNELMDIIQEKFYTTDEQQTTPMPWENLPDVSDCESAEQAVEIVENHLRKWREKYPNYTEKNNGFPLGTLQRVCNHLDYWYAESTVRGKIQLKHLGCTEQ